jgi:hypothetical protein
MYFDLIPDIKYSVKPIGFPFSETDYVTAKNFFKRYTLNEKVFSYAVFFKKYTIKDSDRLDTIAERYYDNPFYDWIIVLTNNMINATYDWPLDKESFDRKMDSLIINPFTTIHHYETEELQAGYKVDGIDVIALKGGLSVTQEFHDNPFTYYNGEDQVTIPGSAVSRPISVYENEYRLNESRREIYILKKRYLNTFVNDFKKNNKYEVSSDFISSKLKRTSI